MYSFELSGGMRQRVTIILSTLLNPSLLIADEVTSALDVSTQRAVGEMLIEFRDRGFVRSVIAITHDLSILAQIADSILVMYASLLAEKASTAGIVKAPLHPYTQMLLASPPEVGVRYDEATLTGIPGRPRPSSTRRWLPLRRPVPVRPGAVRQGATVRRGAARPSRRLLEGKPGVGIMTALQIDQVSKFFQGSTRGGGLTPALRKVSFDIDHGEVVTLIGESGSGKTTLGRIILRLTPASSGRVVFDGNDISAFRRTGLRDYYRQVQGVFQDPFSSDNPVYKADRVFELIRAVYFPQMARRAWQDKTESALTPSRSIPAMSWASTRTSSPAASSSACSSPAPCSWTLSCWSPTRSSACWTHPPASTSSTCSSA